MMTVLASLEESLAATITASHIAVAGPMGEDYNAVGAYIGNLEIWRVADAFVVPHDVRGAEFRHPATVQLKLFGAKEAMSVAPDELQRQPDGAVVTDFGYIGRRSAKLIHVLSEGAEGHEESERQIEESIGAVMSAARREGLVKLAFPLFGTGVHGTLKSEPERVSRIMVRSLFKYLERSMQAVVAVPFDHRKWFDNFRECLNGVGLLR